jgi:hypothetical protein
MRKGSLNLSIQAIVIIVLAMTLLGLGLVFVRTQFVQLSDISTSVQTTVQEQILDQLRQSGDRLSLSQSLVFNKNDRKTIGIGVQNIGSQTLYFKLNVSFDEENSDPGFEDFDIRHDKGCLSLSPAEAQVPGVSILSPRTPGTFALRVSAFEYTDSSCSVPDPIGPVYATELSFITVG